MVTLPSGSLRGGQPRPAIPAAQRPQVRELTGMADEGVVEHRHSLLAEPRSYRWQGLGAKDTGTTASPSPAGGIAADAGLEQQRNEEWR